jgi:hypothetical protein
MASKKGPKPNALGAKIVERDRSGGAKTYELPSGVRLSKRQYQKAERAQRLGVDNQGRAFTNERIARLGVPMRVITTEGEKTVWTSGKKGNEIRSRIAAHWGTLSAASEAVARKRHGNALARLASFAGSTVTGSDGQTFELLADYKAYERMLEDGSLRVEEGPYKTAGMAA